LHKKGKREDGYGTSGGAEKKRNQVERKRGGGRVLFLEINIRGGRHVSAITKGSKTAVDIVRRKMFENVWY